MILFFMMSCSSKFVYNSVKNSSQCVKKNGYWYNDKCWRDYEDNGIPDSKIDSTVAAQMKIIKKTTLSIDGKTYPLLIFLPVEQDDGFVLFAVYGTKDHYKSLIFPTGKHNLKKGTIESPVLHYKGGVTLSPLDKTSELTGKAKIEVIDPDKFEFDITGEVSGKDKTKQFSFKTNQYIVGAGSSYLEIKDNEAYLSGSLGTVTYAQIKDLIKNHPEVRTIIMTSISGSVNDAVNMHTGRLLRKNGFTTKLLSNSDISSGGVDLFCAGNKRIVEKGAKVGVHSWCCVNGHVADELPKEHPAHKYQLAYFTMVLGKGK